MKKMKKMKLLCNSDAFFFHLLLEEKDGGGKKCEIEIYVLHNKYLLTYIKSTNHILTWFHIKAENYCSDRPWG
jgi:hypothetical protein